jgi:uncharacterized protein (DUF58 family)
VVFTARFFLLLAITVLLSLAALWQPEGAEISAFLSVFLTACAAIDLLLTPRQALEIKRRIPGVITQGKKQEAFLEIRNRTAKRLYVQLRDSTPFEFVSPPGILSLFLKPHSQATVPYTLLCYQRGEFLFGDIFYRISGPLGLVQRQEKTAAPASLFVFPDVSSSGARDLALSLGTAYLVGRRRHSSRGEGREFESLREYQRDDDYRLIDWKASARHGKWISRQYQTERDQRLLILLDLGRLMSPKIGHYCKLDYAVNAAVRLAQTALFKGDLVGLLLFSHEIAFYLPPHKGAGQMAALTRALVSAQPRRTESNYRLVFNYAARRNSRRTLMVCFTDLLDLEISRAYVEGMRSLVPRHLPMTVAISDSELLQAVQKIPDSEMGIYEHAAAEEVWEDYQRTIRALRTYGTLTVNVPAQELTLATINRYLDIKNTARL